MRIITLDTKSRIISISSGKGGVGKTCVSVNLGILLAKQGYKVCLFDADTNLANINIMLKLAPDYTMEHVLSGQKTLNEITLHKAGIEIIPGASGLTNFITLTEEQKQRLLQTMKELKTKYDYLIIDNPAGISENVLSYIKFSDYSIIVITPEPTSLTDAFALIRVTIQRGYQQPFQVIVNNASNKVYAYSIFKRFCMAVEKHIGSQVNYLGHIVSDELIASSVCLQNPVVLQYPNSASARDFHELCYKLVSRSERIIEDNPHQAVIRKIPSTKQPDFSTNEALLNKEKHQNPGHSTAQPFTADQLKTELMRYIKENHIDETELRGMLLDINNAYIKRFDDYAIDLPQVLQGLITNNSLSEPTLRNLILNLQNLYQKEYSHPLTYTTLNKNIQASAQKAPEPLEFSEKTLHSNQELIDSIRYASKVDK